MITGPAGSLLLMDIIVVHGSSINITPMDHVILYVNVSACDNRGDLHAPGIPCRARLLCAGGGKCGLPEAVAGRR